MWGTRTIVNAAADEAGEGEHAVEDAIGGVGEGHVLSASGAEVGYGAEHADGREAGDADEHDLGRRRSGEHGAG
jgi:hypothetical protein